MKGSLVGRRRIGEPCPQAVDQRVGRFMSDNVMRQARKNRSTVSAGKVAEEQPLVRLGIKGVSIGKSVRRYFDLMPRKRPTDTTTKGELESRQNPHHDGIGVLRAKPRIGNQVVGRFFRNL